MSVRKLSLVGAALVFVAGFAWAQEPLTFGSTESAKWSGTTADAAGSKENKRILARGEVVSVVGEIVDVASFLEFGARGEGYASSGAISVANGQPAGIVDDRGQLHLIFAEAHDPRRDGRSNLPAQMSALVGKRVVVTGLQTEVGGQRAIYVRSEMKPRTAPAPPSTPIAPPAPLAPPAPEADAADS